jgi:hypothetical protein
MTPETVYAPVAYSWFSLRRFRLEYRRSHSP